MKNYHEGLVNSMQALALSQLQNIFKNKGGNSDEKPVTSGSFKNVTTIGSNNKSNDIGISLNYYNLGVQQEYMRRKKDCEISYNLSKRLCETDNIKLKKKLNLGIIEIANNTPSSTKFSGGHVSKDNTIKYNKLSQL
jgi:hypothetical protein